jgi:hypothetical protein
LGEGPGPGSRAGRPARATDNLYNGSACAPRGSFSAPPAWGFTGAARRTATSRSASPAARSMDSSTPASSFRPCSVQPGASCSVTALAGARASHSCAVSRAWPRSLPAQVDLVTRVYNKAGAARAPVPQASRRMSSAGGLPVASFQLSRVRSPPRSRRLTRSSGLGCPPTSIGRQAGSGTPRLSLLWCEARGSVIAGGLALLGVHGTQQHGPNSAGRISTTRAAWSSARRWWRCWRLEVPG